MLKAGVALSWIDSFHDLLEENGDTLSNSSNLRQLLPFVTQEEISQLKKEIFNKHVSLIFDGMTHVCEAMVILAKA